MRLDELIQALPAHNAPRELHGGAEANPVIRGLGYDSRAVSPGDLFFALRGVEADGHRYLDEAVRLGAAALIVESLPPDLSLGGVCAVVVPDARRALAPIAARFFGNPSRELDLVGVTGTNGKTSTTYLIESILAESGRAVGLIGTVEQRYAEVRTRATNTTPESLDLQRTLRAMRTRGIDTAVMEVSSHGLDQGRVEGCRFRVAAFTNLTQDHLDHHGDMDAYQEAKLSLMSRHLDPAGSAVVNVDDPNGEAFVEAARERGARVLRVSRRKEADAELRLEEASVELDGSRAQLRLPGGERLDCALPLLGDFNLENLVVAAGAACALDVEPEAIARGVERCPQVPGRIERVSEAAPGVIVDYAHTPDAVDKLLATLRPLCSGRLIAVFGCGGDRDRAKRPLMARAAARHADLLVATSDNPRSEDPERILDDVETGLAGLERVEPDALDAAPGRYARVVDRREAIRAALAAARAGDTVVIAGKGHEDYQIVGREKLPFSDRDEALRALAEPGGDR